MECWKNSGHTKGIIIYIECAIIGSKDLSLLVKQELKCDAAGFILNKILGSSVQIPGNDSCFLLLSTQRTFSDVQMGA